VTYPPRAGTYPADHEPKNHSQHQDYLRRIAEAIERIADAVVPQQTFADGAVQRRP